MPLVKLALSFLLIACASYVLVQARIDYQEFKIETIYTMTHCDIMTNEEFNAIK